MLWAQTKFILDEKQYLMSGLHFILPCIILFMSDNPFIPSLYNLCSFYQATDEFVPKYCRVWLGAQPLTTRYWISWEVCLFCHHIYARLDFIICIWHCFFSLLSLLSELTCIQPFENHLFIALQAKCKYGGWFRLHAGIEPRSKTVVGKKIIINHAG